MYLKKKNISNQEKRVYTKRVYNGKYQTTRRNEFVSHYFFEDLDSFPLIVSTAKSRYCYAWTLLEGGDLF